MNSKEQSSTINIIEQDHKFEQQQKFFHDILQSIKDDNIQQTQKNTEAYFCSQNLQYDKKKLSDFINSEYGRNIFSITKQKLQSIHDVGIATSIVNFFCLNVYRVSEIQ